MDYTSFREAGHQWVNYIADYLQNVQDKPLFTDVEPEFLNKLFEEPLPDDPKSLSTIQKILDEKLVPYCTHVNHRGYMGLITPSPNPIPLVPKRPGADCAMETVVRLRKPSALVMMASATPTSAPAGITKFT